MKKSKLHQFFKRRLVARILTSLFVFLALSVFVAFYYLTPLRSKVEATVYDLKMFSQVDKELDSFLFFKIQNDFKSSKAISADSLVDMLKRLIALEAKHIVIALPNQIWATIRQKERLYTFVKQNPSKITLGRPQGFFNPEKQDLSTPPHLEPIAQMAVRDTDLFYFYDSLRPFRRQVVRSFPVLIPKAQSFLPHLSLAVAQKTLPKPDWKKLEKTVQKQIHSYQRSKQLSFFSFFDAFATDGPSLLLNYPDMETIKFEKISLPLRGSLLSNTELNGKIAIIGASNFIPRGKGEAEGSHLNTPWQSDHTKVSAIASVPVTHLIGIATENLLTNSFLRQTPEWVNFLQVLLFLFLGLFSWYTTTPRKALAYLVYSTVALIGLHLILMRLFYLHLPLADVIAVSLIANAGGAFRYSYWSSRLRELQKIQMAEKKKIDSIQSQFLRQFSGRLASLNQRVLKELNSISDLSFQPTMQKMIERLKESSKEFDEYLRGISQVSKISNTRKPQKSRVDILSCIEETLIQLNIPQKEMHSRLVVQVEEKLYAFSDSILLKSILYNLLSNAFKYSENRVTVSAHSLNDTLLRIHIQDDGPGIPTAYHEKIFEKFYRVKNDQVYKIKGNGLGLYLTKYFAELLKARLSLLSSEDQGCTFSIDIRKFKEERR